MEQRIGATIEDFTLQSLEGGECSLAKCLEGKRGVLVVFWSGVCSHCVRYDEYLNTFTTRHPEIGIAVIASRHGETPEQIRASIFERKLFFPILHDPAGRVAEQWLTKQTPRAFLVDSNRVLLYRGAIDNYKYPADPEHISYLEPAIQEFLADLPLTRSETASFGCAIQSVYYILPKAL